MNELLILHPECGDVIASYEHEEIIHPLTGEKAFALKHKPSGECIYLGTDGCTIHDRAPAICKEFDCRRWFLKFTRPERRRMMKMSLIGAEVFKAGRRRLDTL